MSSIDFINEAAVKQLLSWPLVIHAVDQALQAVCRLGQNADGNGSKDSFVQQPARSFTKVPGGILLTMPGFIGNYPSSTESSNNLTSTLACKLLTSFPGNVHLENALPSDIATIMLFDSRTGLPKAAMAATEITTWRTVAASLVATKHLWFARPENATAAEPRLAIIGAGVLGRMHAIGMVKEFKFASVSIWNRTRAKADKVANELLELGVNNVSVADSVEECVSGAEVIVTATNATEPLLRRNMLKKGVHINAIGVNHHSELADEVYAQSAIYVDSMASARIELAALNHPIVGQVGEVILGQLSVPKTDDITVFQSMGMAVEDAAVAQAVLDLHRSRNLQE